MGLHGPGLTFSIPDYRTYICKHKTNRYLLTYIPPPQLDACYTYLLQGWIGPFCSLRLLRLVRVISYNLVLVLQHSIENCFFVWYGMVWYGMVW